MRTEELVDDMMLTKCNYELRKKTEQLEVAILRVSVLKKKISIIKREIKKINKMYEPANS